MAGDDRAHAPSQARQVLRRLRSGDNPAGLLKAAFAIDDPAHRAPVLAALACAAGMPGDQAATAADGAITAAQAVERPGQKAETWSAVLGAMEGPRAEPAIFAAIEDIQALPDGQWTHDALHGVAAHVGPKGRQLLLERALSNAGFEAEGAKAVLGAADLRRERGLVERAEGISDPEIRRRVLGHLLHADAIEADPAIEAAWAVPDPPGRWEALRVLAWDAPDEAALARLAGTCQGRDAEDAARLLCAVAAKADRMGLEQRTREWLTEAGSLTTTIDDEKRRAKVLRKIQDAMAKAGIAESPGRDPDPRPERSRPATTARLADRTGHRFALVNGYRGGLSGPHLRACARGAALCAALGHELWLVDFPTDDLHSLVDLVTAESDIGEDAGLLRAMLADGRLRLLDDATALAEDGTKVATTPHPDDARSGGPDAWHAPVTLFVGLGKQGLPANILQACDHHYELTGLGITLETATAMGILADRLARVGHGDGP